MVIWRYGDAKTTAEWFASTDEERAGAAWEQEQTHNRKGRWELSGAFSDELQDVRSQADRPKLGLYMPRFWVPPSRSVQAHLCRQDASRHKDVPARRAKAESVCGWRDPMRSLRFHPHNKVRPVKRQAGFQVQRLSAQVYRAVIVEKVKIQSRAGEPDSTCTFRDYHLGR